MIKKRQQLTAEESGVQWALARAKKGYLTISNKLKAMMLNAFNNQLHVVILPNTKATLKVKNADGKTVSVRKILTMVGIGTIFSDMVQDHPTIKNNVCERAFRYIISSLGCVRGFTDSHIMMCRCTQCICLQTPHCSLQAKRGILHHKIAIDLQQRITKVHAAMMARGWGDVVLHPTPSDAIRAGTCTG
jgi:hypothetical protein